MRNLTALMAVTVLLTCAAQAGEVKKTKPAPKPAGKNAAKVSASTQTAKKEFPAAESEEAKLEKAVIAGLKDWDLKLLTLRTRFTQEVDFSDAGLKQRVEGVLSYMKPDLLKIEHIKPARQLVYTDKSELWVYKPEDSQAVRTSWNAWKKNQSSNFSGIMDFGNYGALTEKNNIKAVQDKAAPYYITVVLTPKDNPGLYTLTLALSSTDYFPAEAALTVDKTTIKTRLDSPEKNADLDKTLFRFVPPKGTEVLEFKN